MYTFLISCVADPLIDLIGILYQDTAFFTSQTEANEYQATSRYFYSLWLFDIGRIRWTCRKSTLSSLFKPKICWLFISGSRRWPNCKVSTWSFQLSVEFLLFISLLGFIRLHEEKVIYSDNRLVNWRTKLKTALSNLEVETMELEGRTLLSVPDHDPAKKYDLLVIVSLL
jgi:hypothetical protein